MKAFLTSFRGRLTVLLIATLAVSLTAYSLVLGIVQLGRLSGHIDEDLRHRARDAAFRGGPPFAFAVGGPGGPQGGGGWGGGPVGAGGFGGPPPDQQPPEQGDLAPGLRRPRFIRSSVPAGERRPAEQPFDARAADRGSEGFSEVSIDGEPVRVYTMPWRQAGRQIGTIQVARDLRDYQELKRIQWITWLALVPLALGGSVLVAFILTDRVLAPLEVMRKAALRMGEGDLKTRLAVHGKDEIAGLAQTLNGMASNLERSFDEQQRSYASLQEAYESQKRFTADASHELRTPLARMQLATSSALRGPESGYREALETADGSARSMAKLVRELLMLARADAGQLGLRKEPLDLRLVVSDALSVFEREVEALFPAGPLMVEGDADHLERVVANLIENAIRYTPEGKPIRVSLTQKGNEAVIAVEDSGEGIEAEHLPHLFERFYRADAARRTDGGCGLGLAIAKSVIEAHGGTIRIESEKGRGTRAIIALPVA